MSAGQQCYKVAIGEVVQAAGTSFLQADVRLLWYMDSSEHGFHWRARGIGGPAQLNEMEYGLGIINRQELH